jgi:HSP20 family protein
MFGLTKAETRPARLRNPFELMRSMMSPWDLETFPSLFGRPVRLGTELGWAPKLDVYEKDGELFAKMDLPGVKKEDVTVTFEEGYLVLKGERKEEKEIKEESYYRSECDYGTFLRRIPLDFEADPGLIKAVFKDGVLEVRVPILAAKSPPGKEIPIS